MVENGLKNGISAKILVIDDDRDILTLLGKFLVKHGYQVETTISGMEGQKLVDSFDPDLVMCDYRLDDIDGADLLAKIKEKKPDLPVIIITGYSDLRTAIKVVRMGAFDYMTKPFIPDEILLNIKQALEYKVTRLPHAKNNTDTTYLFTSSFHSKNLEQQIGLVAATDYSVIIYGESGVGKEGVARLIHQKSGRARGPFVAMDCGAISKDLAGSELFGHEKGSFTGAQGQKMGHFEMANGGTLFLDEIANLPYEVQTSLLRVLQERMMRRIGGTREIATDVRIIVASNERLSVAIHQGKFREDLYHRLNEFDIEILPLRKRKDDIMFFADIFLKEICKELNKNLDGFEPEVQEVLIHYPWPGNVRELKNIIKRAALLVSKNKVSIKALPFEILNYSRIGFENDESNHTVLPPDIKGSIHDLNGDGQAGAAAPQLKKVALEAEYKMILDALNK
ncbi:MAG: sigma-54-dependent Fis family transcriptional regulator, partial [Bacteroidota bacterium]|nr:sigma-54-dependent Fis family transcriptional regulator [Bacteroidota bacterium]